MTTKTVDHAQRSQIDIFVVAHTNVGKTTLLRTLLGKDVGEIDDAPDVTLATVAYDLVNDHESGALRLWDTPGFSDSFRLAKRLLQKKRWVAWVVRELWDRIFNRKLWRGQLLALELRERANVILYPVNLQERPFEAVYVGPELQILAWIGKPVLAILNQKGNLQGQAVDTERAKEWRTHLSSFPTVRGIASLDAYTRCWIQELSLFNQIGLLLPEAEQDAYLKLAATLGASYAKRLDESVSTIADYLFRLASDKVDLEVGWFDSMKSIWETLRKSISWMQRNDLSPLESAMLGMTQRYAEASKAVTDKLIAINRLDGEAAAELMSIANTKIATEKPLV